MKKIKRSFCSLLATTMVAGLIPCAAAEENDMYPIEGNVTLTLGMMADSVVNSFAENLFETPLGKAWQEATGVTIEVEQYNDFDALNLMLAGGEYPDLLYWDPRNYAGGVEQAVSDGVILPINDYAEYVPDLMNVLEEHDDWRKSVTTNDGYVIGAPFFRGDNYLCTSAGLMVRQDWLDELNLEVPQTADELYNVLKAFKEEKGATAPLTGTEWLLNSTMIQQGLITTPFNLVKADWYQVDGQIHLGTAEKEYKDVLAYLNKLYSEGLLDNNYVANDTSMMLANMTNGTSGMTVGPQGGVMGNLLSSVEKDDPTYNLTAVGSLVANAGDVAYSGQFENAWRGDLLAVTTQCDSDKVEAAMKFLNYGYTEAGHMLLNFGIEGESYEMVDGYPTYTELITKNPDGLTMQQALSQYTRSWLAGPMVQDRRYMEQYAQRPQQKAALETWSNTHASDYMLPILTIAADEQAEYNKLWTDISTYIYEMRTKYISGEASLENFETEYLGQLEKMGIDRVIEIMQNALDSYNAR